MYPRVTSLAVPPSIRAMRPPRSVTESVQASGQSSGHAVSTVDSGGAMLDEPYWERYKLRVEVQSAKFKAHRHHRRRVRRARCRACPRAGAGAASRWWTGRTITSSSRCCTRWPRRDCRRGTSRRRSGGSSASRPTCACCSPPSSASTRTRVGCTWTAARRSPTTRLIVASGVTHSYFGHDDWPPRAPGLKTLDDALEIRRRVLLAFERAEREPDRAAAADAAHVRHRRRRADRCGAGGRARRDRAARPSSRSSTTSTRPSARILLIEAGPSILPTFPASLQRSRAPRAAAPGRGGARRAAGDLDWPTARVQMGEERIGAGTVLWAAGIQASSLGRGLGAETDRAGRVAVNPDLSVPGHPEVFIAGDLALVHPSDRQAASGGRAGGQAIRQARSPKRRAASSRRADRPVPLSGSGQSRHHWPQRRDRGLRVLASVGIPGVAVLALPAHLLPDRLQEPALGDAAVGGFVPDVSAKCPADYREGSRGEANLVDS